MSTYEKEMLALVKSIRKWRPYLLGKPFTIHTNQKSLKYLLEQRITTPAQTRWLPKILGYEYVIEYKKGTENLGTDSLSRVVEFQLLSISTPQADWWKELQAEVTIDHFCAKLVATQFNSSLLLRDRVWFKHGKISLSPTSRLIQKVIRECHSSPTGGHFRFHKTLSRVKTSFFFFLS